MFARMRQLLFQLRFRPRTISRYIWPHCITGWWALLFGSALAAAGRRVAFNFSPIGKRAAADHAGIAGGAGILANCIGGGAGFKDIVAPGQRAAIRIATP